jgi:hypothetical protein
MANLTIETALEIWRYDLGYKKINSLLVGNSYPFTRELKSRARIYGPIETIEYEDTSYDTADVIRVLKEHMAPGTDNAMIYYRGGSEHERRSFLKPSFTSITDDMEQAQSFVDGGVLYTITVDNDVKRINTGVEHEVLLEPDVYWEWNEATRRVRIRKPSGGRRTKRRRKMYR